MSKIEIEKAAATDLKSLLAAKQISKKRMLEDPSPANLTAYKQAAKMVDDYEREHAPNQPDAPDVEPCFKSRTAAMKHLKSLGYKIGRSKIYLDSDKGILRVNTDGTVPHSALRAYVDDPRSGLNIGVYESDEKVKGLQVKIKEKEYEKLCQQVSMLEFQRERAEGLHIKISEYEAEIASRAAVFEAMLRQSNEAVADRIIIAAGIKQAHRQLLIDLLNEALMDALAAYVAQDEIIGEVMEG